MRALARLAGRLEKLSRKYALVQRHCQDPHPRDDEQRRYIRRRDTEDGMVKIEAVLHPEEAELVWTMLNHAAARLPREPDAPAYGTTVTPLLQGPVSGSSDDSAESRNARLRFTNIGTSLPGHIPSSPIDDSTESSPIDDSTESRHAPLPTTDIGPSSSRHLISNPIRDSAESRNKNPIAGMAVTSSIEDIDIDPGVSPEEASGAYVDETAHIAADAEASSGRSLLDRLLDEADALRLAEAVPHHEDEPPAFRPTAEKPSVLRQRADAAKRAFNRADALVFLAQGYLRGDRPNRSPIEVTITIPDSSLRAEVVDPVEVGEMGEAFLSRETVRRLSCDAGVVEVVENEHGVPLSVGRKRRTIAGALKRALHKRDTACTYPGCTNRLFLEGHHIQHWADGGETSLGNATLLCSLHHRYVHEYGYVIEMGTDQRPQFRDPHGRLVTAVPARPKLVDLGWPRIHAQNAPLAIDADTIACEWDGNLVNYDTIVGHLVVADGLQ